MRKLLSVVMVGALIFTINSTDVCAASDIKDIADFSADRTEITVSEEGRMNENDKEIAPVFPQTGAIQPRGVFDLSEKNAKVNWNVRAESSSQSQDFFKTNTTIIEVELKSDIKSSVTVFLLDSAGTELAEKTATLSTNRNAKFKFENLTSEKLYKVKVKNNGQSDINISGMITQ